MSDYHRRIELGLDDIKRLCRDDAPDPIMLPRARATLGQVSIERGRFINQVVVPRLLASANYASARDILALQNSFAANRLVSDQHVSRWTDETIAADWQGYRAAAAAIWRMMEQQRDDEQALVIRHLEHVCL
ncbi:hypothetical protein K7957_11455 [Sphingomonas yunnanensis]|nr:hypothetical protein [Sphingomonas yunnanensis]